MERPNPFHALKQVQRSLTLIEFAQPVKEVLIETVHATRNRSSVWLPPSPPMLKVNVDASWVKGLPYAAVGVVIRDCLSTILSGSHRLIPAASPQTAEAVAVRDGMILASNLGFVNITIESDCKQVIDACKSGSLLGDASNVIKDVKALQSSFSSCAFAWTNRERNLVAHLVAKLCMQNRLNNDWIFKPPPELRRALVSDAQAVAALHGFS